MREAAALAGLNVLQLINDYTAIAINYGIFRRKVTNSWALLIVGLLQPGGASSDARGGRSSGPQRAAAHQRLHRYRYQLRHIQEKGNQQLGSMLILSGYFNQAERRAMREAAALAGLNVLQLINDYTAIAINYGIVRRKVTNSWALC
ncbi:hypothetical protein O0L34_g13737 [Tuta absoluta]|nr:hypothetical protein O0L34_g13737 [Tuta absoluta]